MRDRMWTTKVLGGFLSLFLAAGVAVPARGEDTDRVRSRTFDVEYFVNENALPLDSVQLWFTHGDDGTWHQFGFDEDRHSPITFHAPDEGLFGFFLVLTNSTGASSEPPTPSVKAHQRVFVDFSQPVVQLHAIRQTTQLGQRVLQIRWTAVDSHLTVRPIELSFLRPPETTWRMVDPEPLANTGRYDWKLPDEMSGSVAVRVTVSDLGGHRVESEPQAIELSPITAQPENVPIEPATAARNDRLPVDPDATALPGSKKAKERVARLLAQADEHRTRGEHAEAVARLRETIKLDPQRTQAFVEMADMLYCLGDLDRAQNAYEIALKQRPNMRAALHGTALIERDRKNYSGAAERLRTILRYNPSDAEAWMSLGDVAIFQGDELLARDCYNRATSIDPSAANTIAEARQRLAMMTEASRGVPPRGK